MKKMKNILCLVIVANILVLTCYAQTSYNSLGRKKRFTSHITEKYRIMIDYKKSFEDMVRDGEYTLINPNITASHFPIRTDTIDLTPFVFVDVVLITFKVVDGEKDSINRKEIFVSMYDDGFRPAHLRELLAFNNAVPNFDKNIDINAIGSTWRDSTYALPFCPFIERGKNGKELMLVTCNYFNSRCWNSCYYFLAVRIWLYC